MKAVFWVIFSLFVVFALVVVIFLVAIGLFPILPSQWFPAVQDEDQLLRECDELIASRDLSAADWSPHLAREDYPPEISRLQPHSVEVWEDRVVIWVKRQRGIFNGYLVVPEQGIVEKIRDPQNRHGH